MAINKKIWIGVAAAAVAAALFLGWWLLRPSLPIADALPDGAFMYARLAHADAHARSLVDSDFAKEIAAIDIPKVMAKNGFDPLKIDQFAQWQIRAREVLKNELFWKVFGRETALAAYGMQDPDGAPFKDIVLALRLSPGVAAVEFVGGMFKVWGDEAKVTQTQYQGFKIYQVVLPKQRITVHYVRVRDVLVAALDSPRVLRRVVDVARKKAQPLSRDQRFIVVRGHSYPKEDGFVYVDMSSLARQLRAQFFSWLDNGTAGGSAVAKMEEAFGQLGSVTAYGLSFEPGTISRYKLTASLDPRKMTPVQRRSLSCPKAPNASLSLVPANAIGYSWGNCFDFQESWQQMKEQLLLGAHDFAPEMDGFKRKLEKRLKIDIEKDVLPLLGREMGGYLTDIDTTGGFPFPRFLLFVKVKDMALAQALMRKATANPLVPLKDEEYGKARIHYMSLSFGANMDPGYSFLGDYLLFASSSQLLKKSADVFSDPDRSLGQERIYQSFGLAKGEQSNAVHFFKSSSLALRVVELAQWIVKYLAAQVNAAGGYKQEIAAQSLALEKELDDQDEELIVVTSKLAELKSRPIDPQDDPQIEAEIQERLQGEVDRLTGQIAKGKAQKEEYQQALVRVDEKTAAAELMMYNVDHVLLPVVKGIQHTDAQAVRVSYGARFLETELFLK